MDFKLGFNSSNNNNNSNNSNNSSSDRSSGSISKCRPPPAPDSMPSKLPRTDSSFSNGQQQQQQQQHQQQQQQHQQQQQQHQQQQQNRNSNSSGSKIGPCSPTDSSTEDSIHVPISSSSPAPSIQEQQQQQQQQNDQCSLLMPPPPSYQMGNLRPQQQQQLIYQQYKQPGLHLGSPLLGLADVFMGPRYPFTALQWAELEHQALVFKYILARAPIPPELVAPIRNSLMQQQQQQQSGWGSSSSSAGGGIASGFAAGGATTGIHTNHLDAEPGRCRRTDGKKWRCARPIVPDQKYCERHINRGRHKKKSGAAAASSSGPMISSSNNPSAAGTNPANPGAGSNELLPSNHHHHSASQFLDTSVVTQRGAQVSEQQQQQQHYSIQHTNQQQQQQQQQQMMMMLRGSHSSGGSGFNTNSTGSSNNVSHFQAIPLQSGYNNISSGAGTGAGSAGEGTLSMKDRFLNGISKATSFDLRPEQLLFSEVSGGTRSSVTLQHQQNQNQNQSQNHHHHQQQQSQPYLSIPTGANPAGPVPTIPTTSGQVLQDHHHQQQHHHQVPAVQIQQQQKSNSSTSSNPESPYYSYSKLFIPSDETEHCLSTLLPPNQNQHQNFHQHHHPQQQNQHHQSYYLADLAAVDRKPDTSQALRQLFNDWPRSRDASTMTSWSDSDENNNNNNNNKDGLRAFKSKTDKMSSYNTHLSISIPASTTETTTTTTTTTTGSDHDQAHPNTTTNNNVTAAAAAAHNDLRLCMGSFFCGDDVADSATNNPSKSSLIGSSSSGSVELGWFSAARASVGGPLAEAFNASEVKSAGFSFLLGGSTGAPSAAAAAASAQHVVSPTGVLQKATLGSFSESSSSASSPGSIKVEQLH